MPTDEEREKHIKNRKRLENSIMEFRITISFNDVPNALLRKFNRSCNYKEEFEKYNIRTGGMYITSIYNTLNSAVCRPFSFIQVVS